MWVGPGPRSSPWWVSSSWWHPGDVSLVSCHQLGGSPACRDHDIVTGQWSLLTLGQVGNSSWARASCFSSSSSTSTSSSIWNGGECRTLSSQEKFCLVLDLVQVESLLLYIKWSTVRRQHSNLSFSYNISYSDSVLLKYNISILSGWEPVQWGPVCWVY